MQHEPGCHGVDEDPLGRDVRVFERDRIEDFIPHAEDVLLGVRFGHAGQPFPRPAPGQFEGEAHDALDTSVGEDDGLNGALEWRSAVRAAPGAAVLPLGVLAHDDEIDVADGLTPQRAAHAGQEIGGANVGVLIEALADGQPQAAQRHGVGHAGESPRRYRNSASRGGMVRRSRWRRTTQAS